MGRGGRASSNNGVSARCECGPPYLQISDLRSQIKVGRYQPGDRLPSNAAMATEYRSASATIRRALDMLRDEGLVLTGPAGFWQT